MCGLLNIDLLGGRQCVPDCGSTTFAGTVARPAGDRGAVSRWGSAGPLVDDVDV